MENDSQYYLIKAKENKNNFEKLEKKTNPTNDDIKNIKLYKNRAARYLRMFKQKKQQEEEFKKEASLLGININNPPETNKENLESLNELKQERLKNKRLEQVEDEKEQHLNVKENKLINIQNQLSNDNKLIIQNIPGNSNPRVLVKDEHNFENNNLSTSSPNVSSIEPSKDSPIIKNNNYSKLYKDKTRKNRSFPSEIEMTEFKRKPKKSLITTKKIKPLGFSETLKQKDNSVSKRMAINSIICQNIYENGKKVSKKYFFPSEFPKLTKIKSLPQLNSNKKY